MQRHLQLCWKGLQPSAPVSRSHHGQRAEDVQGGHRLYLQAQLGCINDTEEAKHLLITAWAGQRLAQAQLACTDDSVRLRLLGTLAAS